MKTILKQVTYLYPGWQVRVVNHHERSQERSRSVVETQSRRQERPGSVEEARWLILVIWWNRSERVSSVARTYRA